MDTRRMIEQGCGEMGLSLPAGGAEKLAEFLVLLRKWNRGQNLTAITEPEAMVGRHLLDSLAGAPWVLGGRGILDVGSGAGFPGIPLAVSDPARPVVLLDSRNKRIQFLTYVRQALSLDNVTVVRARFEDYRPEGNFGTLTARAFSALPGLIRAAMPFITRGARLVAWQGTDPTAELQESLADERLSCTVHPVRVPGVEARRHIVVVEKGPSRPVGN